ncbi:MAG TPA: amidohydrolase family protein [Micromonospora sp.]|nr:amidohydrolase family protein [Micromonospora sp.]
MPGIDLHTHLAPDLAGAELLGAETNGGAVAFDGRRVGPAGLYRPDRLEAYLDKVGLDEAIVSVPPPFYRQHLPAAESAAWVAAVNEGLLSRVEAHPRLTPLAYLPLEHPQVAVAEYDRIAGDDRWAGVVGSAGGGSVSLAEPALRQLWRQLDQDGRMVQLHPGHAVDPRLEPYYLTNLLGNPVETTVAAAQLVFGEVLHDFPGIRFVLLHCGGCLPGVVGRWERGHATARPGVPSLPLSPAKAARRFYVDVLAHEPAVVDLAVTVFGAERLVLGSDWPFPMGTEDPLALVAHRGPEYVAQVAMANAAAALGRNG